MEDNDVASPAGMPPSPFLASASCCMQCSIALLLRVRESVSSRVPWIFASRWMSRVMENPIQTGTRSNTLSSARACVLSVLQRILSKGLLCFLQKKKFFCAPKFPSPPGLSLSLCTAAYIWIPIRANFTGNKWQKNPNVADKQLSDFSESYYREYIF